MANSHPAIINCLLHFFKFFCNKQTTQTNNIEDTLTLTNLQTDNIPNKATHTPPPPPTTFPTMTTTKIKIFKRQEQQGKHHLLYAFVEDGHPMPFQKLKVKPLVVSK